MLTTFASTDKGNISLNASLGRVNDLEISVEEFKPKSKPVNAHKASINNTFEDYKTSSIFEI